MPTLPPTVQVGPLELSLVYEELDGTLGELRGAELELAVDPEQADDQLADTVLHELLHAVIGQTSLWSEGGPLTDPAVEEVVVAALTPWLLGIVRDNPDLVAFLVGA